ncbi:MAG: hypothetical protein M1469_03620 [Bacteroidetes bacterium]|nr:hypothetical protein [Bacteroidota bacterium]MCL5267177.1 hypothetical protein [Bacteroidota bacterium]
MAKKKPPKVHRTDSAVEFKLLIEPFNDPVAKRSGIAFYFRTTEEFQNFVYELVLGTRVDNRKISFNIVGLKTPLSDFPRPGPAVGKFEMENPQPGEYTIIVDRRGKKANQFKVDIRDAIRVLRGTKDGKFIDVFTDRSMWMKRIE